MFLSKKFENQFNELRKKSEVDSNAKTSKIDKLNESFQKLMKEKTVSLIY